MTDEDAIEREKIAAALAAFKSLRKAGYPPELAEKLGLVYAALWAVAFARPPRRRGFRKVLSWIGSILNVATYNLHVAAFDVGDAIALQNNHRALFERAQALSAAMTAQPRFAPINLACASKLEPRRDESKSELGAGVAEYLVCVGTALLSK